MWGLGILALLSIYISVMHILIRGIESIKSRILATISALVLPVALPFLHLLSSAHQQFQSLCSATDREVVYITESVDYLYLGKRALCKDGYKYLKNYKGIECERAPKEDGQPGWDEGIFRYTKGANWSSPECSSGCLNMPYVTQETCQISCMNKLKINEFSHPFHYDYAQHEIIKDKLYAYEATLIDEGKVMAKFKNFHYYPYGNTWAKILGASSGSAPIKKCEVEAFVQNTDVYKPRTP